jgi:hypothetical protein
VAPPRAASTAAGGSAAAGAPPPPANAAVRPAASAPATADKTAASSDALHIQVLATADQAKAQALVARLVGAGFKAYIAPSDEGGRTVYRVRVGPITDRALATKSGAGAQVPLGLDSWISPGFRERPAAPGELRERRSGVRESPPSGELAARLRPRHRAPHRPSRFFDLAVAVGGGLLWAACFSQTERVLPAVGRARAAGLVDGPARRSAPRLAPRHGVVDRRHSLDRSHAGDLRRHSAAARNRPLHRLAAYLGAYHLAFVRLGRSWWRRGGAALLALPALWCVLEVLRSWLLSGFPWNLAGAAWIAVPGALPLAAWIGVYGVSFLLVLVNVGVARAIERRRWEPAVTAALAALLLLALGARFAGPAPRAGAGAGDPHRAAEHADPETPANAPEIDAAYRKMLLLSRGRLRSRRRAGDLAGERRLAARPRS